MNLETNLQMLVKVNKYTDHESILSNFYYKYLLSIEKNRGEEFVYSYLYLIYTYYDVQVMSRLSNNLVEAIRLLHVIIFEGCVKLIACF